MSNRKKAVSIAFAAATAVGTAVGFTTPAFASSGTWQVTASVGGVRQPYSGMYKATNSGVVTLQAGSGPVLQCSVGAASASGSIFSSAPANVSSQIGTIKQANFGTKAASKRCDIGPVSDPIVAHAISATLNQSATLWLKPGSIQPSSGVMVDGQIKGINAHISGIKGGIAGCSGSVAGSLPASYNNSTHTLTIDKSRSLGLTVTHVFGESQGATSACFGALKLGSPAWFSGPFNISFPTALSIKDP